MDVEQVEYYLKNKEALYRDWYVKQIQYETSVYVGEQVGLISDTIEYFNNFLDKQKNKLKQRICPHSKEIKECLSYVDTTLTAISLLEAVNKVAGYIDDLSFVGESEMVAFLLITEYGLDNLCA